MILSFDVMFSLPKPKSSKKKEILSRIALRKSGNPLDIAKAVKFLITDAEYITGQNINVDGGRKLNM